MEVKKEKRIGNISARPMVDDERYSYEILYHYPNPYYKREGEYIPIEGEDYYQHPEVSFARIHKGCFKNPESCYVVAFITNHEDEPDVRSVGLRPWELSETDEQDFKEILKYVFSYQEEDVEED